MNIKMRVLMASVLMTGYAHAGIGSPAGPVSSTGTHNIQLTINDQIAISFAQNGPSGAPGADEELYFGNDENDYGLHSTTNRKVFVTSNRRFEVKASVAGTGSNFTYSNPGSAYFVSTPTSTAMPLSMLKLRAITSTGTFNSGSAYTSYSSINAASRVVTGFRGAAREFLISYSVTPGYAYDGGVYTATVTYTATQL